VGVTRYDKLTLLIILRWPDEINPRPRDVVNENSFHFAEPGYCLPGRRLGIDSMRSMRSKLSRSSHWASAQPPFPLIHRRRNACDLRDSATCSASMARSTKAASSCGAVARMRRAALREARSGERVRNRSLMLARAELSVDVTSLMSGCRAGRGSACSAAGDPPTPRRVKTASTATSAGWAVATCGSAEGRRLGREKGTQLFSRK